MFEIVARELRAKLLGRRGQGGLQTRRSATHSNTAPPVWRAPEGPEGLAAVPVGGGRARAGLEIDHSEPQARVWRSRGRAAAHRHTQRPGPKAAQRSAQNTSVATQRQHAAPTASGRAVAHGRTKQPGPTTPGTPAAPQAPLGPRQSALTLRRRRAPGVPCS